MVSRAGSASSARSAATKLPAVKGAVGSPQAGTPPRSGARTPAAAGTPTDGPSRAGSVEGAGSARGAAALPPSEAGSAAAAAPEALERAPSHVSAVLGSKNHPEEENELFGLRKMMRILGDEEQHNEKLLHALHVLLGMSAVESSLERMVERGALDGVFHMLQHFKGTAELFKLEHVTPDHRPRTPSDHSHAHPHSHHASPAHAGHHHGHHSHTHHHPHHRPHHHKHHHARGLGRPPLFPSHDHVVQNQPFFANLDDGGPRQKPSEIPSFVAPPWLTRPPSFGARLSEVDSDSQPPSPLLQGSPRPGSGRDSKSVDREETPAQASTAPQQASSQTRVSPAKKSTEKGAADDAADTSATPAPPEDIRKKYGGGATAVKKYQKPEKPKFPPPPPAQVLQVSLKIIFNLSRVEEGLRHIALGSRLLFLTHVLSPQSPPENRMLGLRALVNLSSSRRMHDKLIHASGMLSAVAAALIEQEEPRTEEETAALEQDGRSIVSSKHSSPPGSPARSALASPLSVSSSSSESLSDPDAQSSSNARGAEACKEGEVQFKAISIICNLSLNDDPVPPEYRIPTLLRLRLLQQGLLEKLASEHGIDHYAYRRHELEQLLVSRRKLSIREQLWEHHDVVSALLQTVLHGTNKFRHKVLKMFVNFSADENIAVEMVEGDDNIMEPLVSLVSDILAPLADVLAERAEEPEEEEEEPTPDPRYLPKVQAFFKSRFHSVFEMWVFFDRQDNWSVSVHDIKELGKQLLPQAWGIKLSEIALVMDFKKMKFLDPHETIRAIAWHELPAGGKTVPLTRALEEVALRRREIMSKIKQEMKLLHEHYSKEQAAAKERARKERIAARQLPAHSTLPKIKKTSSVSPEREANTQHKAHPHSLGREEMLKDSKETDGLGETKDPKEHVSFSANLHDAPSDKAQASQDGNGRGVDVDGETDREGEQGALLRTISGGDRSVQATPLSAVAGALVRTVSVGDRSGQATPLSTVAGALDMEVHDDRDDDLDSDIDGHDDEETLALKAEQKRLAAEMRKQQKIQHELGEAYKKMNKNDILSLELLLAILRNVCKDEETHERLVEEMKLVTVIKPLLALDPEIHSQPRDLATDILDELGEDADWKTSGGLDLSDSEWAKLDSVAAKWLNGILLGAFNSWLDSSRLQQIHTLSILECYKLNSAEALLPAASGVANKALERFLVDAHDDGIWLGKIGVNAECMRALWCALKGCDLHGVPRRMLNIVDLRHRQNLVALAQVDVSESDIRDEGLECLVAAVLQMKVELVVLKAVKANLGPRAGGILRRLLEDDNDLEELCIGRNNLGGAGMAPLCKGIRNHPNLNLLDVSANEIDAPGGEEIGALLTTCSNLTELDCSWNNLTGEDGAFVLQGLAINKSVQVFRAAWNRFGKVALPDLKEVLARETIFYEFDIRKCGLDSDAQQTYIENKRPSPVLKPKTPEQENVKALSRVPSGDNAGLRKHGFSQHELKRGNTQLKLAESRGASRPQSKEQSRPTLTEGESE